MSETITNISIQDAPLVIAGKTFSSRFLLGTGKFKNKSDITESIISSGTEIVTVALRRIDLERHEENILEYIPECSIDNKIVTERGYVTILH